MTAVALLSGGLDSTVAATLAARRGGLALCITADYGQRARQAEAKAAASVARALGAEHRVVALPFLAEVTRTALVDDSQPLPALDPGQLDDVTGALVESTRAVWVPNRNGLLIAVAATFAEALGLERVVVGFNREEAATFPDNSVEFVARTNAALALSTCGRVVLDAPTATLDKVEIVREGYRIGAPIHYVWSCYRGGSEHCWRCESCLRLARALEGASALERFRRERSSPAGECQ